MEECQEELEEDESLVLEIEISVKNVDVLAINKISLGTFDKLHPIDTELFIIFDPL
jgi:hypothetical protein